MTASHGCDDLPERRALPHLRLSWQDGGAVYLITVCTRPRGINQLASPCSARAVRETLEWRQAFAVWQLHACVLMPDHLHLLATVPACTNLARAIPDAKRYVARHAGILWQRDFHDRRVRRGEHYDAKLEYLRQNPVRAGLVERWQDWPFFWEW